MASLLPTFDEIRKKNRENNLQLNQNTGANTLGTLSNLSSTPRVSYKQYATGQNDKSGYDLNRSAVGGFRDNDSNFSYFTNKSFKSVLGDNADTSKMNYRNLIDTYNNASGDQQADVKKAINDEIVTQREYAKNGEQGSLKVIDYLNDLNSVLDKHGSTKGKSLLRQIGDYAATGGIVGTLGRGVSDLVNNVGGAIFGQEAGNRAKANLEKMDNSRQDLGAIGVMDTALATAANYGANIGTGGLWGLANAGIGGANAVANTINDKTLAYDDNGNAIIRHKTDMEKAGELGNAALNAAFAVAGKAGIGPNLTATGKDATTGLAKLSAKDLVKYAAKELPWAGATTYMQAGLNNLAQGKDWNDMDAGELGKDFILNLGQDVGMDAANYGAGKLAQRNAIKTLQEAENRAIANDPNRTRDLSLYERETNVKQPIAYKNSDTMLDKAKNVTDSFYTKMINRGAVNRLTKALDNTLSGKGNNKDVTFTRMTSNMLDDVNAVRQAQGKNLLTKRNVTAFANAIDEHLTNHLENYGSTKAIAQAAYDTLTGADTLVLPGKVERNNKGTLLVKQNDDRFADSVILGDANDGRTSLKDISPRSSKEIKNRSSERNDLLNNTSVGGSLTLHPIPDKQAAGLPNSARQSALDISTSIVPQNGNVVKNTTPENTEITFEANAERNKKYDAAIKRYYKKYGEDFEEKMPSALQDRYNELLDKAPRDKNDVYTDPITGGKSIDATATPDIATGTEPLSKAADGTPEFVKRYTSQTKLPEGIDNGKAARKSRFGQFLSSLKGSDNTIVQKFYDLAVGNRKKAKITDLTVDGIRRYVTEGGVAIAKDARFVMTENFVSHLDKDGHITGIREYPEPKTGIQVDANPLTKADIATLDKVVNNPDTINYAGKGSRNGDKLRIEKNLGDNMRVIVEILNNGKDLELISYYKVNKTPLEGALPTSGTSSMSGAAEQANPASRSTGSAASIESATTLSTSIPQDETNSINNLKKLRDTLQNEATSTIPATDGQKTSKLAENVSNSKNFSTETRKALKSDPIGYKPTTNEERLARANQILSTKSIDEVDTYLRDNFFNVKDKERNSGDVVLAGELSKLLDAKGQYDRSTEIINKMSKIASKQGQDIQALSLMKNRSPEGIANMAQSAIKKGGGEMTGELRGKIVKNTQEIGKIRSKNVALSEENAKITEQIMAGKGDLAKLRKRQMEIMRENRLNMDAEARQFSQIDDIVSKNTPDNRSVFGSIYRASLLSGPRTHTGNLVSNTVQNALNATTDRLASGIDLARSKITGKEREIVGSAGGRVQGLKRGISAAGEAMKTGNNLWDGADALTGKQATWGQGGELEFKNKIANTMVAKPTNFVFRAMSAGDLPFRYTAFENAIRTEAKRQGINNGYKGQMLQDYINSRVAAPDPELQAYGIRKGNESVYDADTLLSKGMSAVDRVINGIDNPIGKKAAQTAKTLVAPFVKVPSKVLSTAIDYSPLGSVQAIVKKVGSKNYTTAQFETDIARSGFGTGALVGLGYALSAAGLLTGGYPDDQTERNRWKAEGIEPNSVKIGDKYVSLNYLGPMAMLTAMGAGVQQRIAKGEDAWSVASGTVMDTLNSFLDQSYVQGLNNAVQAVTDSQRYGESYLNSLARGLTPNLLRQTATATDSKQRQVNNPGEAIISGIPGLSQTLDAKVDTYGREIENKQTLPLGQMWDALKISNSRETNDVIDEVSRLHGIDPNNGDYQITPTAQQGSISVNGTNVKLTDKQKTQLQKDTGEAALVAMAQVMKSSEYAGLTDDAKAAALKKAQKDAQKQARKQFIEANNISAENNLGTTNSGGKVTEDYTAKAISSATSNGERKNGIKISDSLSGEHKSVLEKYNSMSSEDWEKYVYGNSPEEAAAEYKLALAKYENDVADGKLTDVQKIKRQKELAKLEVSQKWSKDVRDIYSLAGTKADIQELLDGLDGEAREEMVGILNGLNNAMYEAGVISKTTYNTRGRNINNVTSSKSSGSSSSAKGISAAEASALNSATKALTNNLSAYNVRTSDKPTTNRKMTGKSSSGGQASLAKYSPRKATISVKKGK